MSQKYGILVYLAEPRAQFERSLVRTSDMPKQKCCLFSSVRTPDITQQQNQLPGCFLVLQHHFFLSLPRPSLEKKDSRCKGGERDMDICRQKDHKPWSRPSFCGLSGYEPKNMASWSTWQSLVHNSSSPWFEPRTCQKQKCCLFSSVRTQDITQQHNQLPGCFLVLQHHFFLSLPRPSLEKGQSMQGG